ncbi:MAG TPA: EamA family transporter [Anaeromyxobacteraceae bacterium]|nr:EamA family transporter [Anaeromyxobacteraceae bacterium]
MKGSSARLFAVAVAIWGTTWIAITFQLGRAPPEASVALRFAIASALLLGWCGATGRRLRFPAAVHAELALLGLFMFCLSYLAVYRAETHLVSGLVAVGYSASPLVNAAISRIAFGTPAPRRVLVGGLLGMAGIALVFWPEIRRVRADAGIATGALLVVAAVLASGIGNVFASRAERLGLDVWQKMAWGMAWGAGASLLAALLGGEPLRFDPTPAYLASLLYLAVFGSILAFAAFLTLLERVGAARAGYVGVMTPVVALAVSGVVEGFAWGPTTLAGIAVVVAGNLLVLRRPG